MFSKFVSVTVLLSNLTNCLVYSLLGKVKKATGKWVGMSQARIA